MNENIIPWEEINQRVYWHRLMKLEDWKIGIDKSKATYLIDAIKKMDITDFVYYYGVENFKRNWPKLKNSLPNEIKNKASQYDVKWSLLISNTYNLNPSVDFFELSEIKRKILIIIAQNPGISLSEIERVEQFSKSNNEIKKIVMNLINEKKISIHKNIEDLKLYPSYKKY